MEMENKLHFVAILIGVISIGFSISLVSDIMQTEYKKGYVQGASDQTDYIQCDIISHDFRCTMEDDFPQWYINSKSNYEVYKGVGGSPMKQVSPFEYVGTISYSWIGVVCDEESDCKLILHDSYER